MFGSSNITSSWGQPQQNQQQAPSAFGQPAATGFGTGSAFGSGGAFGQQQQQQPQANPMFGNLSTPSTSAGTSSGFGTTGAFGSTTNTSNSGGLFGAPKPATGFGAFGGSGGTSTFGSGPSTAGSSTGGIFGGTQATAGSSSFGSGLFGGAKPAGAFGTPQTETTAPVTTGTANPQYSVYDEKDGLTITHYQSITCMPAYRGSSFEELRAQDYQQGRKTAGGFGQTTFGQPAQNTGLFGQPAPANTANTGTSSLFGSTAFGSTTSTAPATNPAFGAFGQSSSNTGTTGTGGLYGSSTFGQPQGQQPQQQPSTGFGAFSQPQQQQQQQQQQPAGGGLFGGGGAFGNTQNKPFGGFGSGTTGAFGSAPQQQQPPAGGLFGQSQQQGTGAFGGFGQNAPKPSIFGTLPAQSANAFGGFGAQPQQAQQPAQQTGSLFGNSFLNPQQPQGQQPQQTTGLFGTQPAQQQQTGSSLFGGGSGLFGNTNTQQQQPAQQPAQTGAFGLFGANKPATTTPAPGGLFGNTFGQGTNTANAPVPPQSSLFGASLGQSVQQAPNAFGTGSLFSKPATNALGTTQTATQPAGSAFGSTLFGSTLGSSTAGPAAAPSLTASIAQPIGANLPLFSMLPPGPRSVALDQQPKKKPSLFNDVPTRSPVPRLQLGYSPATSKLRGFTNTYAGGNGSPLSLSSGKPGALSLSKAASKSLLGPDAFLSNSMSQPGLGSGGRQSVKKLVLDKKVEPSDLFSTSGALKPKITFNPALSVAAREHEASGASISRRSESPAPTNTRKTGHFTAHNPLPSPSGHQGRASTTAQAEESEPPKLQEGDYYVKPDLSQLRKASHSDLSKFSGLVVGRVGYGEIHFLEDVDLTGLPKLGSLLGDIVRFDDKECCVYPDSDDADKPAPGSGLNVRARIELIRCWALDKATREPIKDAKHPSALRHYKRLRNMKDTHFEGFDIEEGKWTFTVDHF